MNIQKANRILGKAIAGFQEDEIEDLAREFEDIEDPDLEAYEEAKGKGTPMKCMDCGAKFKKKIGPKICEVKCPKCGSFDTEIA